MGVFSKTVSDMGRAAVDKTRQVVQATQTNSEIRDKTAELSQSYNALGSMYYEKHKNDPEPEFAQIVATITQTLNTIEEHQKTLSSLEQSEITCPSCGASASSNAAFCPNCGQALGQSIATASEQPTENREQACPYCGAAVQACESVCSACGSPIE